MMKNFLKKKEVAGNDTEAWQIYPIKNGLKCVHLSNKYIDYFEIDELTGDNAFKDNMGMTPLQVFDRLMSKTPFTKGFIYKSWNIEIHEKRGFIIKARASTSREVEEYKKTNLYERYRTNESMQEIEMLHFLSYIEENKYEN